MLKIAIYHYRVPYYGVVTMNGRQRVKGPPVVFVRDDVRKAKKIGVSNRGGKTIAFVYDGDSGYVMATGLAVCSMSDNYNYRVGREKALWAAMQVVLTDAGQNPLKLMDEWDKAVNDLLRPAKKTGGLKPEQTRTDAGTPITTTPVFKAEGRVINPLPQFSELSLGDLAVTLSTIETSIEKLKRYLRRTK